MFFWSLWSLNNSLKDIGDCKFWSTTCLLEASVIIARFLKFSIVYSGHAKSHLCSGKYLKLVNQHWAQVHALSLICFECRMYVWTREQLRAKCRVNYLDIILNFGFKPSWLLTQFSGWLVEIIKYQLIKKLLTFFKYCIFYFIPHSS